jgi:tryptophanyl-tRNA synthetase
MFNLLLFLQKLGGNIFIPITNDESYVDGKVKSLSESRRIAYEEIIPSIISFGFNPEKTKIFVLSDYPDIYNLAINISKNVTNKYVSTVFGAEALDNSGKAFYRSAVQLAQILLPQLEEFGGIKNTLIPVGIDQHPYILIARDIAKRMGFIPPSEIVFKFQNSLIDPFEKMSGSKPKTAIYLTDSQEEIKNKINKAFTGAVSVLDVHKELGGIPEACSVFSLLYFHHPDDNFVSDIYSRYKNGKITMKELKTITNDFITQLVLDHQKKKKAVKSIDKFILNKPLRSFIN